MAVEKTRFDNWLKDELYRDLIFRSIIGGFIASCASYYSLAVDAMVANEYFIKNTNIAFRLLNVFGTIGIFFSLIALMFKDLDELSPIKWGFSSTLGGLGGVFRRLAGDLTLWSLGVVVFVLVTLTVYGFMAKGFALREWGLYSFVYIVIMAMCFIVALLNIAVRQTAAPVTWHKLRNPYVLGLCYAILILGCPIYIHYMGAWSMVN